MKHESGLKFKSYIPKGRVIFDDGVTVRYFAMLKPRGTDLPGRVLSGYQINTIGLRGKWQVSRTLYLYER